MLRSATEEVRARLLSRAPPHVFEEIRSAIATVSAGINREMSKVREFTAAQRLVARLRDNGELKEATLFEFAKRRKYEETVAALAALSHTTIEVIRPLMQSLRDDGVLVPCRVAGLSWETVHAVLESRLATGSMGPHELANARSQFGKMTAENARRLLSFWQVEIVANIVERELSRDGAKRGLRFSFLLMLRRKWQADSIGAWLSGSFNAGLLLRSPYVICQLNIERVG